MTRVAIRYSNSAGVKIVGNDNVISELLVLDTDWLATLDYPPIEMGFEATYKNTTTSNCSNCNSNSSSNTPITMYPRNTGGVNNTLTRTTVGRSGNALIVTSQYSNTVSYTHAFSGGMMAKDSACVHADNSRTVCRNQYNNSYKCAKEWHHNWVHDCFGKCVRGDDNTVNLNLHHNVIFNCGMPNDDGMAQSFGVVMKGNHNSFYHNTVFKSRQADVCLPTANEGPNTDTVLLNSVVHRWSGKGGPDPTSHPSHFKAWGGMDTAVTDIGQFVDFSGFDFRPKPSATTMVGKGIVHPPEVPGPPNGHVDAGAYQHDDQHPWIPGCTFAPECKSNIPPPAPPAPPSPPAPPTPCAAVVGFQCLGDSYCGPKESFYWEGDVPLAECTSKCTGNSTCHCFDFSTSMSSAGKCRLHTNASDIASSGRGFHYTAYWRNSTLT
jgi:hypothetical protein